MHTHMKRLLRVGMPVLLWLLCSTAANAAGAADMTGWEKDGAYNRLYKAADADRIKGTVTEIREAAPQPGMAPGVLLKVREGKSEEVQVHLCPVAYTDAAGTGIKKGDVVKIRGAWAEVNGKDVFLAAKVKKGEHFELKLRVTKDGTPFWSLTPEERAAHMKESD